MMSPDTLPSLFSPLLFRLRSMRPNICFMLFRLMRQADYIDIIMRRHIVDSYILLHYATLLRQDVEIIHDTRYMRWVRRRIIGSMRVSDGCWSEELMTY